MNKDWKKYNGALITNLPPHKKNDIGKIKMLVKESNVYFARWVTNFDCQEEMPFWYIIKKSHTSLDQYSSNIRNQIKKGLKNCVVKKVSKKEIINFGYEIYHSAFKSYKTFNKPVSEKNFIYELINLDKSYDFWGIYHDNVLIGYSKNRIFNKNICEFCSTKFHPEYLKYRPSEALFYTMSKHYLGENNFNYIHNGTRPLLHQTNIQDFLVKKFQFRKAYCCLKIKYHPFVRILVNIFYPLRNFLKFIPLSILKKIEVVLFQEELKRQSDLIENQKRKSNSILVFSNGNFKSGSTWVTAIINELLKNKKNIFPKKFRHPKHNNWINRYKIREFIFSKHFKTKDKWISKSHIYQKKLISEITRYQRNIKVINIERNLEDVIVSHYFHLMNLGKIDKGFKEYFNNWGRYKAIQYINYNKAWKHYDFCLKLKYEDLKKSQEDTINKIAKYLNIKSYDIESIIKETNISNLRKKSKEKDLNEEDWFFRKGVVGDGKKYFTEEMEAKLTDIKEGKITLLEKINFFFKFNLRLKIKYFLYQFFPTIFIFFDKKF